MAFGEGPRTAGQGPGLLQKPGCPSSLPRRVKSSSQQNYIMRKPQASVGQSVMTCFVTCWRNPLRLFPVPLRCREVRCDPEKPSQCLGPTQKTISAHALESSPKASRCLPPEDAAAGRTGPWCRQAWGRAGSQPRLIRRVFRSRGNHADSHKLGVWLWVLISVPQLAFLVPIDKSQQAANAINKLSPRLKLSSIPLALFIPFRQTCTHTNNNKKASP